MVQYLVNIVVAGQIFRVLTQVLESDLVLVFAVFVNLVVNFVVAVVVVVVVNPGLRRYQGEGGHIVLCSSLKMFFLYFN